MTITTFLVKYLCLNCKARREVKTSKEPITSVRLLCVWCMQHAEKIVYIGRVEP